MLKLQEDERFYFDAAAADRAIRFIETFCKHYEGAFVGQPFKLLDWQKDRVIRPLFGWKRRPDGLRRFRELFLLTAKGAGKTPLLSAIGLFCLVADGEASPHCISMASTFEQANYTFDNAKCYIKASRELSRVCECKQYQIVLRGKPGKWTTISGKPTGRSGSRPSCCIADEAHEWEAPTVKSYKLISANLFKRQQPFLLVATNAPESSTSFCRHLYERALKVEEGKSKEETLLPVIYEASIDLEWTSEAAARAANPSIPDIVTFEQLAANVAKAQESPEDEADYRRLNLSQQVQSAKKWLDIKLWDACSGPIEPEKLKDSVLFVGVDLSQGDDLCAVDYVWATAEKMYVDSHFWLPQSTAQRYEMSGVPYAAWEAGGFITLLDEPTISISVKQAIARHIIATAKPFKLKAVCYDRYKADDCIAALEAAALTCVPIGQGWGVSRGCEELDRRLKEGSIVIAPNPVLRSHAETVEVKEDDRGNYWPVKPGAKGKFAGKRIAKIDGIAGLVTALTEARKHSFPKAAIAVRAWIISKK